MNQLVGEVIQMWKWLVRRGRRSASLREAKTQTRLAKKNLRIGYVVAVLTALGLLVAVVVALVGEEPNQVAGDLVEGDQIIGGPSEEADAAALDGMDFDRDGNPRFSFWYTFPSDWTRFDPDNGDGHVFSDPRIDETITVTYSGRWLQPGEHPGPDMEAFALEAVPLDAEILDSRSAGSFAVRRSEGSGQLIESRSEVPGWRVLSVVRYDNDTTVTRLIQYLFAEDRVVTFVAEAPEDEYPEYEAVFNRLASSLRMNETGT